MAPLSGCLPLLASLVYFIPAAESSFRPPCHRLFPLHLTAAATPCRYYCAYFDGYSQRITAYTEDDGTPCRQFGGEGVCWSGRCLTRYTEQEQWPQQVDASSKQPLRIRKRDTTSFLKGASVTKTAKGFDDGEFGTKSVKTSFVKTATVDEDSGTVVHKGLKGSVVKSVSVDGGSNTVTKGVTTTDVNLDVDPFAVKTVKTGSRTTETLVSRGSEGQQGSKVVGHRRLRIAVHRGGSAPNVATKHVSNVLITRGSTSGLSGLTAGGDTGGVATETSKTSFVSTVTGRDNAPVSVTRTVTQGGTSGGQINGETSTTTNTVSTVTTGLEPTLTVGRTTDQAVTSFQGTRAGSVNSVTGQGMEVEVPGYTTGMRRNWKWVLGRRVGFHPPTVQALDPELLYYKLGLPQPQLPYLPEQLQVLLRRLPVRPVGSDLYGYLGSGSTLEKLLSVTQGVNGYSGLSNLLFRRRNLSPLIRATLLKTLLTSDRSSQLSSPLLERLLRTTSSRFEGTLPGSLPGSYSPFGSPFGGPYGGPYGSPYGGPWSGFPGGQFPGSSWPFYPGGPQGPFGRFGPGGPFTPGNYFNPYYFPGSPRFPGFPGAPSTFPGQGSTSAVTSTSGVRYTLSADGRLVPSTEPGFSVSARLTPGETGYAKTTTTHSVTSGDRTGVRYILSSDGTLVPLRDPLGGVLGQSGLSLPRLLKSVASKTLSLHGSPSGYTLTSDGHLVPSSDDLTQGTGLFSSVLRDGTNPLSTLLRSSHGQDSRVTTLLRNMYSGDSRSSPNTILKLLGARPGSRLYEKILKATLLRDGQRNLLGSFGDGTGPFGAQPDGSDLTSLLGDGSDRPNGLTSRYLAALSGEAPELLGSNEIGSRGPLGSARRTLELLRRFQSRPYGSREDDPLTRLLYPGRQPQDSSGSRDSFSTSSTTEQLERLLGVSERRPESQRTTHVTKEVTKALLSSGETTAHPVGHKESVVSKLVSVTGTSPTQITPQGVSESRVVKTSYRATNLQPTSPVSVSPVTTSGLQFTGMTTQQSAVPTVLGVNHVSSLTSGSSSLPFYGSSVSQPLYTTGTNLVSSPGAFVNGHFVSSTSGLYGNQPGQPTLSLPFGTGGYTTFPTTAGYVSTSSATHPYLLGSTLVGGHPHYVVEGHEAPGTRWQLKVWRHHPGVSSIIPGFVGVGSSPLGSIVSHARETVTGGLQLGSQPGHFGFASSLPSGAGVGLVGMSPQGSISGLVGGTTQYIVHAPDGSVVLSRQPGTFGSSTLLSPYSINPASGLVVSRTTHSTAGTVSGAGEPMTTRGLLMNPFQTTFVGGNGGGGVTTAKYQDVRQQYSTVNGGNSASYSDLTGGGSSGLLNAIASESGSESGGSSSGSLLADALLSSQSKVQR